MGRILRPVKTLGNREYAQEKAANPNEPIKSAEVDGDLDTIYALVNGNLDTTNLSASAGIVGTQLAAGANILGTQLSPTANIQASQLAPAAAIGIGQLAPGAAVRHIVSAQTVVTNIVYPTEITICTLPSMPTSGGMVIIAGWWDATIIIGNSAAANYTLRIKRDGTTIWAAAPQVSIAAVASFCEVPVPAPFWLDASAGVANHVYTVTGQTGAATMTMGTFTSGVFFALELA